MLRQQRLSVLEGCGFEYWYQQEDVFLDIFVTGLPSQYLLLIMHS